MDAKLQTLPGDSDQRLCVVVNLSNCHCLTAVAVISTQEHSHVNVENVTTLQRSAVGDACKVIGY